MTTTIEQILTLQSVRQNHDRYTLVAVNGWTFAFHNSVADEYVNELDRDLAIVSARQAHDYLNLPTELVAHAVLVIDRDGKARKNRFGPTQAMDRGVEAARVQLPPKVEPKVMIALGYVYGLLRRGTSDIELDTEKGAVTFHMFGAKFSIAAEQ